MDDSSQTRHDCPSYISDSDLLCYTNVLVSARSSPQRLVYSGTSEATQVAMTGDEAIVGKRCCSKQAEHGWSLTESRLVYGKRRLEGFCGCGTYINLLEAQDSEEHSEHTDSVRSC